MTALLALALGPLQGTVWTVSSNPADGPDFADVQAAVDASAAAESIFVLPGATAALVDGRAAGRVLVARSTSIGGRARAGHVDPCGHEFCGGSGAAGLALSGELFASGATLAWLDDACFALIAFDAAFEPLVAFHGALGVPWPSAVLSSDVQIADGIEPTAIAIPDDLAPPGTAFGVVAQGAALAADGQLFLGPPQPILIGE